MVPKEGGNTFRGSLFGLYTNDSLQSDNLTDALRARGLTTINKVLNVHSVDGTLGGPIRQDRLWFFVAVRQAGNKNQVAGQFFNKTQGAPLYTPDLTRPSFTNEYLWDESGRLTWQVSSRNRLGIFASVQNNCTCRYAAAGFVAPEAVSLQHFWPQGLYMARLNSPLTNKFLLEASGGVVVNHYPYRRQPEVSPTDISTLELSTGFRYNAATGVAPGFAYADPISQDRYGTRLTASYVTGSHAFKAGLMWDWGGSKIGNTINGDVDYQFLRGVPVGINQYATPYLQLDKVKADLGVFVQDQWTVKRLTVNAGLRFDYFNGYVPAQDEPAGQFVPARSFAAVSHVPLWTDLSPRLGASYDLFGNGRTAIKASLGRYVGTHAIDVTTLNNPLVTSFNSVNRTWSDTNGDFKPDCDLTNPGANGECGAFQNANFGKSNVNATTYAPDAINGFGARDYLWDVAAEVQHELAARISLTGGYYRNWFGNFLVTDNVLVTPADHSPYCITAPSDARLPGGGGNQVCGLYNVDPSKFGEVRNVVTQASNFGSQSRVSNFFNISVNTRFGSGARLGGGLDTGRTVTDNCFVVDSPQQLVNCHIVTPWVALTQVKVFGSYPLPADFVVSGIFQDVAGPPISANYTVGNATIAPSLGRNLAACGTRTIVTCTATATVPLIPPGTEFEGRRTQLDLRLTKIFKLGDRVRLQGNVDVYNVLNGSSILGINTNYGPAFRRPVGAPNTGGAILAGRLVEFGGQLTF